MNQINKFYFWLIFSLVILLISPPVISDSEHKTHKHTRDNIHNEQSQSLSAPSSDSLEEQEERKKDLENENLSSPPEKDLSTNNSPFSEKAQKPSSSEHKHN